MIHSRKQECFSIKALADLKPHHYLCMCIYIIYTCRCKIIVKFNKLKALPSCRFCTLILKQVYAQLKAKSYFKVTQDLKQFTKAVFQMTISKSKERPRRVTCRHRGQFQASQMVCKLLLYLFWGQGLPLGSANFKMAHYTGLCKWTCFVH